MREIRNHVPKDAHKLSTSTRPGRTGEDLYEGPIVYLAVACRFDSFGEVLAGGSGGTGGSGLRNEGPLMRMVMQ